VCFWLPDKVKKMDMKKLILKVVMPVALVFTVYQLYSQKSPYVVTISTDQMNIIYYNIQNPITVTVEGVPSDQTSLSCEGCKLTPNGPGKYLLEVRNTPLQVNIVPLFVGIVKSNTTTIIDTLLFYPIPAPKPYANLSGFDGSDSATVEDLLKSDSLAVLLDGCLRNSIIYEVTYFKLVCVDKQEKAGFFENNSSKLTSEMINGIKGLKKGEKIIITDIYVKINGEYPKMKEPFRLPTALIIYIK
jgi:hypothetical protein